LRRRRRKKRKSRGEFLMIFFGRKEKKGCFFSKEDTFILTLYILYIYFRGSKKPVLSRVYEPIHDKKVRDT
jgi:hypothetical protein